MKPSNLADMSREEFADMLETASHYYDYLVGDNPQRSYINGVDLEEWFKQAAARLRNSIPKPVVEVESDLDNHEYWIRVNDAPFRVYNFQRTANLQAKALRTALGINDTEGGE